MKPLEGVMSSPSVFRTYLKVLSFVDDAFMFVLS